MPDNMNGSDDTKPTGPLYREPYEMSTSDGEPEQPPTPEETEAWKNAEFAKDNRLMQMDELVDMQAELMRRVPHEVKGAALAKMLAGQNLINSLLQYLNSTGHKPWRPNPLEPAVQQKYLVTLHERMRAITLIHDSNTGGILEPQDSIASRQLVSYFGIVEEATEYMNSQEEGSAEEQLEELTDILFFWLEQLIMSGFTWSQVYTEYKRKWQVNIKRYEDAKKGDYTWDKRSEGKL